MRLITDFVDRRGQHFPVIMDRKFMIDAVEIVLDHAHQNEKFPVNRLIRETLFHFTPESARATICSAIK
jgi:hypothetical protein